MATQHPTVAAPVAVSEDLDVFANDPAESDPERRTVLGRIAAIMDAFDQGEPVLTLSDLSAAANLPKSTVHRLVEQLRALGWLERDCHNGYRIGMRLFELGGLAPQYNQLRDAAYPHLHALAAKTGLAVQLGVLDHCEVVYLERIVIGGFELPTRLGGRMPAHCTGLGKAMLAFDDMAADVVLGSTLARYTDHTITDAEALRVNLARVRASGVAFDLRESHDGLGCVAAPLRNSGRAIGAISVTGPLIRMDWDSTAEAVRHTAASIWTARFAPSRPVRSDADTARRHGPARPRPVASRT
jgi:DNA-binding IclR family transcriptional regulator